MAEKIKKTLYDRESRDAIRESFSRTIDETAQTVAPIAYSADLLSRHDPYYPMVQGRATRRLALTPTKNLVVNVITGDAVMEDAGFRAFFEGYDRLRSGLTVGAQKLLAAAALYLTHQNPYQPDKDRRIQTEVHISLVEYARLLGYAVDARQTRTPEEAEKEKRRIKNLMKEIRGKINGQLDLLYSLSLSWTERKGLNYQDVRLLQKKGLRQGYITLQFSEDIARYLLNAYVMQYPEALLAIDERSPRAYRVGYKLAYHHSLRRNAELGTANILAVRSLLEACGDIPDYDDIQAQDRGHWESRIKLPLENALDSCVKAGVLERWEYCGTKKRPLAEEIIEIRDYPTFITLYVQFEMKEK